MYGEGGINEHRRNAGRARDGCAEGNIRKGGIIMSINRVILTGKLGRDVELKYTPAGKAVATFNLAVNDNFNREKTHWLPIVVWGKSAENCANYIGKGSSVAIDGRINTRDYENREGKKVYVTEIVADSVQFLDRKKEDAGETSQQEHDPWEDLGKEIRLEDIDIPF